MADFWGLNSLMVYLQMVTLKIFLFFDLMGQISYVCHSVYERFDYFFCFHALIWADMMMIMMTMT